MKKRLIHIYTLTIRLCAPAFTLSALSALGAMLVLLAGCIHQYPDDGQAADVTLRVQLLPERELILLPPITKGGAAVLPEGCLPRVTVEARPADGSGADGNGIECRRVVATPDHPSRSPETQGCSLSVYRMGGLYAGSIAARYILQYGEFPFCVPHASV